MELEVSGWVWENFHIVRLQKPLQPSYFYLIQIFRSRPFQHDERFPPKIGGLNREGWWNTSSIWPDKLSSRPYVWSKMSWCLLGFFHLPKMWRKITYKTAGGSVRTFQPKNPSPKNENGLSIFFQETHPAVIYCWKMALFFGGAGVCYRKILEGRTPPCSEESMEWRPLVRWLPTASSDSSKWRLLFHLRVKQQKNVWSNLKVML